MKEGFVYDDSGSRDYKLTAKEKAGQHFVAVCTDCGINATFSKSQGLTFTNASDIYLQFDQCIEDGHRVFVNSLLIPTLFAIHSQFQRPGNA